MDKTEFRKMIKGNMKSVFIENPLYRSAESEKICKKIISSSVYKNADLILGFMPLKDEVDIISVLYKCLEDGKKLAVPRVIPGTNQMEFFFIEKNDLFQGMDNGAYGILEPDTAKNKLAFERLSVNCKNILILVPGLGFTKSGWRTGRGKGFYDRYLGELSKNHHIKEQNVSVTFLGVCFPIQIVEQLPVEETDIPVDYVIF